MYSRLKRRGSVKSNWMVESCHEHQRLMFLAVVGDVFQIEAARQREIELDGGELPQSADSVHQLHVNLRAVESCFVGDQLDLYVEPVGRSLQGVLGELPLIGRTGISRAGAARP